MFAIAVPSTVTLHTPTDDGGEDVPYATLSFSHPSDDTSKCQMTVATADGHVHTALFDTQGGIREQRFTSAEEIEKVREAQAKIDEERAKHDREVADAANARELKTADDTTANDLSNDAPQPGQPIREYPRDYNQSHATPVPELENG